MQFEITDDIKEKDREEIFQGLLQYNLSKLEDKNPKDLGVYLNNESGEKIAGLIGQTHGNWLTIKYLWVSEDYRGRHIGSDILRHAETTAKQRGCKYSFVDTFSFQAPEFYKKFGYQEIFKLDNYPLSGKRCYFIKEL